MRIIQTEYSFKKVFYHLEQAVDDAIKDKHNSICIMDDTTFGFVKFNTLCIEKNVKPIFGLRLMLTDKKIKSRSKYDSFGTCREVYLIAKSTEGVRDLYKLYTKSTEQKYYFNRIYPEDLEGIDCLEVEEKYIPKVKYSKEEDINTYQCISGSRGIPANPEHQVEDKHPAAMDWIDSQVHNTLPKAKMIKYNGDKSFELECWKGLDHLNLAGNKEYEDRLEYEIDMIKSKNFQDYFMIVSEMIMDARKTMITGPGRGSSGGSLVCYCLGITNIDPIKFGLIFERFIDINRFDLPDIDSDYPDTQRQKVIQNIAKRYKSAYQLGIVSRYKPKSVINDFAKEYLIEPFELEDLKNSIIERSSGDARSKACLEDTYSGTDPGRDFIRKFPAMESAIPAENHARHFGKHAAGIIVVDEDINNYAALDTVTGNLCMEGNDAESIGLLKIDCLGLRTLSVIQNCLILSGVPIDDIYSIDLEDKEVLDIFKTDDLADIFQFDGETVNRINKQIEVNCFSDLAAITSLGRPGALNSGGTNDYIKVGRGKAEPVYYGEIYKRVTESTYGIVVFQEQTMVLLKEYGNLSWGDVNIMRKIISKSRGDEFFSKYRDKFIQGAIDSGESEDEAIIVWDAIKAMGSYAFNKSHAVAYAMISYWCAYCKVKYPLNFLAANLNNAKDEKHGLKMLRQYVKINKIEYVPVDPDISDVGWTIQDGKLIGGLTNIAGIGEKKAQGIIAKRENGVPLTKALFEKMMNPITAYDELYPMSEKYKDLYRDNDITKIEDLETGVSATTIGKILIKDLRDRNDIQFIIRRGGTKVTSDRYFLSVIIEDDTGTVKCTIAPFDMDRLEGMQLSKDLIIGDVVAVKGTIRDGWQSISVSEITKV